MTSYTLTMNPEFKSIEVNFTSKPSEAIRDALKALRFRWHGVKKCWYGYKTEEEVRKAITEADAEPVEEKPLTFEIETTEAYMGAVGFVGSNAGKHLYGAELAQAIRDAIKNDGIKGVTVSKETYSMGQSVTLTISLTDDDFIPLDEFIENSKLYDFAPYGWITDTENNDAQISIEQAEMWDSWKKDAVLRELAAREIKNAKGKNVSINDYHIDSYTYFTDAFKAKLHRVKLIAQSFNYSDSNAMVDYFDVNFYLHMRTKYITK